MHFPSLISFHLLLLFPLTSHIAANPLAIETLEDGDDHDACKNVDCGQGKCIPTNTSFLGIKGFDCVCKPGWQKMQFGPITFPACTVPNCTINYQCGSGAPPPPASANAQPFGLFTPCTFVWCGEGSCVVNGSTYHCKCNEGSANLFNLTGVACFKECHFGADCVGVSLGPLVSPPPPSGNASGSLPSTPPPSVNGTSIVPNFSRSFGRVTMLLFYVLVLLASI